MEPQIIKADNKNEFLIEEGCFIIELLNSDIDEKASIAHARVPVGVKTRRHKLIDTVERYVILSGTGIVYLDNRQPEIVTSGDIVYIPAECSQSVENIGDSDLVFLAVCTPRFRPEVYVDAEG